MVTAATSVQDALDKLELHAPDLIISETTFPDGDGFELRRRVRATPEWSEIPFIFLTAEAAIENKIRGLELGVDDYLTKPIYIKEIVTRINILLQKRQRTRFEERRDGRTRFAGRVQDMPVVDVIQTIEISRKSGVIQFVGERGRQAAIYFRDGRVIDAEAGTLQGEDAVYRLLTWGEGEFEVVFRTVRRREVITMSSQALLMEGMRRLDEWSRLFEQLPPLTHRFEVDTIELAARLGDVPDDNNRILRLVDGERTLLEVIDASDIGDLECLQAISRLYFEELLVDLDHGIEFGQAPRPDTGEHVARVEVDGPAPVSEEPSGPVAGETDAQDPPAVREVPPQSPELAAVGGATATGVVVLDPRSSAPESPMVTLLQLAGEGMVSVRGHDPVELTRDEHGATIQVRLHAIPGPSHESGNGAGDAYQRLYDRLAQLNDPQFERVVLQSGLDRSVISPPIAPLATRAVEVARLAWVEQALGRKLEQLLDALPPALAASGSDSGRVTSELEERLELMKRDLVATLKSAAHTCRQLAERVACEPVAGEVAERLVHLPAREVVARILAVLGALPASTEGDADHSALRAVLFIVLPYVSDWRAELAECCARGQGQRDSVELRYRSDTIAEAVMAGWVGRRCQFEYRAGTEPYGVGAVQIPAAAQTALFASEDHLLDQVVDQLVRQLDVGGLNAHERTTRVRSELRRRGDPGPERMRYYFVFRDVASPEPPDTLWSVACTKLHGSVPELVLVRMKGQLSDAEADLESGLVKILRMRTPRP
jgi:DNA-binding response OmpR family regulator